MNEVLHLPDKQPELPPELDSSLRLSQAFKREHAVHYRKLLRFEKRTPSIVARHSSFYLKHSGDMLNSEDLHLGSIDFDPSPKARKG